MKILHVITSLRTGGAERLMVDILPRLKNNGIDVDLCVFDGLDTPFKRELSNHGVNIIDFGIGHSVYSLSNLWKLACLLHKKRYDIIHTHNTACQLFAAIGSVLCSVVLCTTEHTTSNRRRGWKWYAAVDRWMYGRYKKVICISDKTETALRECIPNFNTPTITIYNGIDVSKFELAKPEGIDKVKHGCQTALIQVAGFRYQKDQKTLIRSLQYLPNSVHAYFVGEGECKQECIDLSQELGLSDRIHFMGIRTDVPSLMKSSDIVVISSHWEGFGLAAVEGMAASKPVIASGVDGLREVVQGAGIIFEHENPKDLADKIIMLISTPAYLKEISDSCHARAKEYDISNMVAGYIGVYKELFKK